MDFGFVKCGREIKNGIKVGGPVGNVMGRLPLAHAHYQENSHTYNAVAEAEARLHLLDIAS